MIKMNSYRKQLQRKIKRLESQIQAKLEFIEIIKIRIKEADENRKIVNKNYYLKNNNKKQMEDD